LRKGFLLLVGPLLCCLLLQFPEEMNRLMKLLWLLNSYPELFFQCRSFVVITMTASFLIISVNVIEIILFNKRSSFSFTKNCILMNFFSNETRLVRSDVNVKRNHFKGAFENQKAFDHFSST